MTQPIALSGCEITAANGHTRISPRPPNLKNEKYDDQYDWKTLFYDVYRSGDYIVFQGPPLLNLREKVLEAPYFSEQLRDKANYIIDRNRANEIWIKSEAGRIELASSLGDFDIIVQPDGSDIFRGKRVLLTLSKNNEIQWIVDWISFHQRLHGADAVLLYDNGSNLYSRSDLQRHLVDVFPDLSILVINWPYKYGPQGGVSGGVGGKIAPWDSDYCQTGVFQHARFRFLRHAKSVLNCDIDELVVAAKSQSVFAIAERSMFGVVHFAGTWVSNTPIPGADSAQRRHANYIFAEENDKSKCPNKWCVVPFKSKTISHTWTVHSVTGPPNILTRSRIFKYRHFKPISNNWKYNRWELSESDHERRSSEDIELKLAIMKSGISNIDP